MPKLSQNSQARDAVVVWLKALNCGSEGCGFQSPWASQSLNSSVRPVGTFFLKTEGQR